MLCEKWVKRFCKKSIDPGQPAQSSLTDKELSHFAIGQFLQTKSVTKKQMNKCMAEI